MDSATAPNISFGEILDRLTRIEESLLTLVRERIVKEWYTTAEVAKLLGKSEYTVREYCRLRKVVAVKKPNLRGAHAEWLISHEALQGLRNHQGSQSIAKLP